MGVILKPSTAHNHIDVKPTGGAVPKGMKRVWIPKHKFWVEVKDSEHDDDVIARITKKYSGRHNDEIINLEKDEKDSSKSL